MRFRYNRSVYQWDLDIIDRFYQWDLYIIDRFINEI